MAYKTHTLSKDAAVERFFANAAHLYDRTAHLVNSRYSKAHSLQNSIIVNQLQITKNKEPVVLDLGCGTGKDARDLAAQISHLRYIGIDFSHEMLSVAKAKFGKPIGIERIVFEKGDIFQNTSARLRESMKRQFGQDSADAVICAYTLHHYTRRQKQKLYREIFGILRPGACLVITDLFAPTRPENRRKFLDEELADIRSGFSRLHTLTAKERQREQQEWLFHYENHNCPTSVEEEVAGLEQAGFCCCANVYQHWQNKIIFARRPVDRLETPSFLPLLSRLHHKLVEISLSSTSARERKSAYECLFTNDPEFRCSFYDLFSVSGATFVAADNVRGRFVMLQDGAKDAEEYDVKLSLPISLLPTQSRFAWQGSIQEYNIFVNRVFQIQRGREGLGAYGDQLALTRKPEFLEYLHAGLPETAANAAKFKGSMRKREIEDWHHCDASEMLDYLLRWRWILWLLNHYGADCRLDECEVLGAIAPAEVPLEDFYFSESFFDRFASVSWRRNALPELAVFELDLQQQWDANARLWLQWRHLRELVDAGMSRKKTFMEDVGPLLECFGVTVTNKDTFDIVARIHAKTIALSGQSRVADAFIGLHERAPAPISYFYFISADGRPKEHFVTAILRSEVSKLSFYVQGAREEHTAVVIALASLDVPGAGDHTRVEDDSRRLLQFRTALRTCADRIIDRLFMRSLVDSERRSSRIRSDRMLEVYRFSKMPRVFVLGSFDQKITFYSQQSRALMLVRALEEGGMLRKKRGRLNVAIVGGGIAGVTAGAGLAILGCRVTIFDAKGILGIQAKAAHRYIHPHLSEWPDRNGLNANAQLPILNWTADNADKVIAQIRDEFELIQKRLSPSERMRIHLECPIRYVMQDKDVVMVGNSQSAAKSYDLSLIAIGFELEKTAGLGDATRYWEHDSLGHSYVQRVEEAPHPIVVWGSGDGGLIDLARASLEYPKNSSSGFDHRKVVEHLASDEDVQKLGELFAEVDKEVEAARRLVPNGPNFESQLFRKYSRVFSRKLSENVQARLLSLIRGMKRLDTKVIFLHRGGSVFRLDSILFNRVLAFLLVKAGVVQRVHSTNSTPDTANHVIDVRVNGRIKRLPCHSLICRHGIRKTDYVKDSIPTLAGALEDLGGKLTELGIASELDKETFEWWQRAKVQRGLH